MPINTQWLRNTIDKHNDQSDTTRILVIQGTSGSNIDTRRIYNPDKLNYPPIGIEGEDIVVNFSHDAPFNHTTTKETYATVRTGLANVDIVNYFDEHQEIDKKTGRPVIIE